MVSEDSTLDAGLKAVADGTRRGILSLLKKRERSVQEIAEEFPVSRPAISKHLKILKEAGLVVETPTGRQRVYALDLAALEPLADWMTGFNGNRADPVDGRRVGVAFRRPAYSSADWRVW